MNTTAMMQRAIRWIKDHHLQGRAIPITDIKTAPYPEVTGYYIPTLLSIGEVDMAEAFARWLVTIQKADGSFTGSDQQRSYVFDTGQVIRGWVSIVHRLPEIREPLLKACLWIVHGADPITGRLRTPEVKDDWSLGARGELSEGVHLYVLKPLLDAAQALGRVDIQELALRAKHHYLETIQTTEFKQRHMLTHFYGYIQEALFELGHHDLAAQGMASVAELQHDNGAVPAYFDVSWVCSTGLAQLAKVWYLLGQVERGDRALQFLTQLQNDSGGFFGSYGVEATYFPAEEISWAVKYAIEAEQSRIAQFFNQTAHQYALRMPASDERVQTIFKHIQSGRRILDAGCGNGRYAAVIKEHFPDLEVHAVDISKEMLRHVRADIATHIASIQDLPFAEGYFDVVYCVEALEHAPEPHAAIAEMSRVLAPGGRLIVIDKNKALQGALQIQAWERWFDIEEVVAQFKSLHLAAHAELIGHAGRPADGLFVAWVGEKPSQSKTLQTNLSSDEWHDSITHQTSPHKVAHAVRHNASPRWVQTILAETRAGDTAVELGSGTGELSAHLAMQGVKTVLLDFSEDNLDFSQQVYDALGLKGLFIKTDVLKELPFENRSVDVVWSSGLLEHFTPEQMQHIVNESARIANKKVISLVPNAASMAYVLGKTLQEQQGRWIWGREVPQSTLVPLFEKAGLVAVREYSIAPEHSLTFLDSPEVAGVRKELMQVFSTLPTEVLHALNQGYLLVTIGDSSPTSVSSTHIEGVAHAHE